MAKNYDDIAKMYGGSTVKDYDAIASSLGGTAQDSEKPATKEPRGASGAWEASRSWRDVPLEAMKNIPSSAGEFAGGITNAVVHPLQTGMNLWDAAAGGLRNVMPNAVSSAVDSIDPNPESARRASTAASAVGGFFKDRYGSEQGIKTTLATDPVGAMADLSGLLYGGAAIPGRVGQMAKAASSAINPINLAAMAAKPVVNAAGRGVANVVGNIGTHTGGEGLQQAFRTGVASGTQGDLFRGNMRGNLPMTDVLEKAKANLDAMGRSKSAAYRNGMAQVSGDKTVLSFSGIDKALSDSFQAATYKGQVKNAKAAQVVQSIADEVEAWKQLPPSEFHTPEGLDALKQKIGGIVESIPMEEKTARMVGNKVYHSIKNEVTRQAPVYADVMSDYTNASEQIREIERTFSLGGKASIDTAMRKLQSLTRNNANTNYGNRLDLMNELDMANEILPSLAGQSLSNWTPRGMGNAVAGINTLGAYSLGSLPLAIATAAVQSPRLMGEATHALGRGTGLLNQGTSFLEQAGIPAGLLGNALYQSGRLPQR